MLQKKKADEFSFHSLSTASAISSYPKPFKRMLRILLVFLMLASLLMHIRYAHYGLSIVFVSKQASTKSSTNPIHFVACSWHHFALKKPLTFVRGFVSRSRAGSNRCRSFCRALPNHSATGPYLKHENNTNKLIIKEFYHYYDLNDICVIKLKYATHWRIGNDY